MFRRSRLAALLTLVALVCTGCLQLSAGIIITHDQDIAVTVHSGSADKPDESATEPVCNDPHFPNAATEPYVDGEYHGCRYIFTLSEGQQHASGILIERTDNIYSFSWRAPESLAQDDITDASFDDFRIAVTFPEGVLEHNGTSQTHGNTVTWTKAADWFAPAGLHATGNAGEQLPQPWIWLAWAGVPLALLIAASIWWTVSRRRKEAALEIPPSHHG